MTFSSRRPLPILLLLLFILIHSPAIAAGTTDYKPVSLDCRDSTGTVQLAIRSFTKDGECRYLLVNPQNLKTAIVRESEVTVLKGFSTRSQFADILERTSSPPHSLQNHGIKHSFHPVEGMFLTVDLCPSRRPFERGLFEALARIASQRGKPVPVAICISGAWLSSHNQELAWLREQEQRGLLAITWVNHSLSHFYEPSLPLVRNFMLSDGTDRRSEILANEVKMLEAGLTPSPFFRFPGLVANGLLIKLLRELSLIPLGADAWLAKGEEPRPGSIILVHGNGNEPQGIVKLMPLIGSSEPVALLPLSTAVTGRQDKFLDKPALKDQ